MTTAWSPNTRVWANSGGRERSGRRWISAGFDLDLIGTPESSGGPTYAAVTSRSYHPGGINVLFGDGSVRFVKDTISGTTWRALGSVSGGEIISGDQY